MPPAETITPQEPAQLAREASRLTADLTRARPAIYWADLLLSMAVVASGLVLAVDGHPAWRVAGAVAALLALYRGVSFIHELTHVRTGDVPGFRLAWNVLVGVPFLVPSLLYDGVHVLHHGPPRYGTAADPEYLPLASKPPLASLAFVAVAALGPVGALIRFGVLTPLSLGVPQLREAVVSRFSALSINPGFRRQDLERSLEPGWRTQEIACWLWSWTLLALVLVGGRPARYVLAGFLLMTAVTVLNQVRTLAAHAWTSEGRPMSVTEQYLDSVNVPPPALLPALWAPVGLRYHALHHLLPRIPYHALGEAHRRLAAALPEDSAYHQAHHRGLFAAVRRLLQRAAASGRTGAAA